MTLNFLYSRAAYLRQAPRQAPGRGEVEGLVVRPLILLHQAVISVNWTRHEACLPLHRVSRPGSGWTQEQFGSIVLHRPQAASQAHFGCIALQRASGPALALMPRIKNTNELFAHAGRIGGEPGRDRVSCSTAQTVCEKVKESMHRFRISVYVK
jgi:hypothetical protein